MVFFLFFFCAFLFFLTVFARLTLFVGYYDCCVFPPPSFPLSLLFFSFFSQGSLALPVRGFDVAIDLCVCV